MTKFNGYTFSLDILNRELPKNVDLTYKKNNIIQYNSDRFDNYPAELENYQITLGHIQRSLIHLKYTQ